jgi:hypothetical protein
MNRSRRFAECVDGSVRLVKSAIDGMVWRALGTVAGAEVIGSDSY